MTENSANEPAVPRMSRAERRRRQAAAAAASGGGFRTDNPQPPAQDLPTRTGGIRHVSATSARSAEAGPEYDAYVNRSTTANSAPQVHREQHAGMTAANANHGDYAPIAAEPTEPEPLLAHSPRESRQGCLQRFIPLFLVLSVIAAILAGGYYSVTWLMEKASVVTAPTDYEGEGEGNVVFDVQKGDTGTKIAKNLVDAGVIATADPFIELFNVDPKAQSIAPGSYNLKKQMSAKAALNALLDPKNLAGGRVTIPEGMKESEIFAKLSQATSIPEADFAAAAKDYTALGIPQNKANSAEGYLFPSTYDVPKNADAKQILTMMVDKTKSVLKEMNIPEDKWHEALTIASIVEKEARNKDDYPKVTRAIENRLAGAGAANGRPMKLQLDSTVAYATNIKTVDTTAAQRNVDSPYNTYKYEGLPVGPISNPGEAALEAYLHPAEGKWLFWVTVDTDTGETKFAETAAEHEKNVQEWKQRAAQKRK